MADSAKMRCPKGHQRPTLQHVFRTLKLQDSDVLNVYLVGSHMWGTCHKNSDWDLVIILRNLTTSKPVNTHKANIEAFILSKEQFMQLLREHSMQVLVALWLPQECVLAEKFSPSFHFDREALARSLDHSRERDLRIAEKHFRKGDAPRAKKVLLHCVRYLELGAQLRENGKITDYTTASSHQAVILGNCAETWDDLIGDVSPILDSLWMRIIS